MNQREFLNAIANGNVTEEVIEFAVASLSKMDAANEKRKATMEVKRAEKEAEKAPIREAILAVMTNEGKTATTLIEEAGVDMKPQGMPALLKGLIEEGIVEKVDLKVTGKGTQRGYVKVG